MIHKKIILPVFFTVGFFLAAETPGWVDTFGLIPPAEAAGDLTGFGQARRRDADAREVAMERALADLSKKIKVQVQSDMTIYDSEAGGRINTTSTSTIKSTTRITLKGVQYLFYEDRTTLYALAHIGEDRLARQFARDGGTYWDNILSASGEAFDYKERGQSGEALKKLYSCGLDFTSLYEQLDLYRGVMHSDTLFFGSLQGANNRSDLARKEGEINQLIDELNNEASLTLSDALEKAAVMFSVQGLVAGDINVSPLSYGDTSFSSEFGRYVSDRLDGYLGLEIPRGDDPLLFQGQYWDEGNQIRLTLFALNGAGEKKGWAQVMLPLSETGGRDIKPQNFNEAMTAMREFSQGALTDGGINVDVWTNKGGEEEVLVFTSGEILQLYFRVNQPAFLRITYRLATGELVLLENSFYIGMEGVNRAVPLPYEFEVQPPFGIEQLIVTAYSEEPDGAAVIPRIIDGERYDVYPTIGDVVAATRGLGRRQKSADSVRVGEALLNMTMMKGE